jgi:3-oxoacyl-[acyl-carrier protein] reductase
MAQMNNPRVLVTGGGAGIGAAIVQKCKDAGMQPVVLDRVNADICVDLSDADQTATALREVLSDGPVHHLVNNVGMVRPAPAESQTLEDMDALWQLNLRCAQQCLQALLPGMREAGYGRIVNITSRAALGKELRSGYAATKAGLIGLTRVWALELGADGITANAIGPGPIATDLFQRANPPGAPRTEAILQAIPVKRMGTPEDVARAAMFFMDKDNGFVTGQTLYVCGGMTVGVAPL